MRRHAHAVLGALLATAAMLLLLPACSRSAAGGPVTVLAASSLAGAFEEVSSAFRAEEPDVDVVVTYGGSGQLAAQAIEGAPADVVATADEESMGRIARAGVLATPAVSFATNRMTIAVERGNPRAIAGVAHLGRDGVRVVLAAPEVPAGRYAGEVLRLAGVDVVPVSLESSVRAAANKVAMGEADAALVYASDVAASGGRLEGVSIPDAENVTARYLVAVLDRAGGDRRARQFVDFLRSVPGQAVMRRFGFAPA